MTNFPHGQSQSKTPKSILSRISGFFDDRTSLQVPVNETIEIKDHLSSSVAQAKRLLEFASQGGIPIEETDIDAVLSVEKALKDGNVAVDSKIETKFWLSLSKLTVEVRPVTITSLQDTFSAVGDSRIGLFSNRASRVVAYIATLTLGIILVVQIQAVQLSSRIQGFDNLTVQGKESADEVLKLWVDSQNAYQIAKSAVASSDEAAKKVAELKMIAAYAAFKTAYDGNYAIVRARASADRLLEDSKTPWFISIPTNHGKIFPRVISDAYFQPPPSMDSSEPPVLSPASLIDDYRHRQEAQNLSDILYRLILPALYGLLGSCIFVLRSVSSQLESFTFTWTRRLLGSARITLGPILGVASLVLIDPSKTDALGNLPQIAIALIAGYSVDLVLSFMDRITSAFGQSSTTSQPPTGRP